MNKRLGVAWLVLECLAISVLAWSELALRSWSSATHKDISGSPDALFQIRFFSWTGAVALGVVMGLGFGAAMVALAIPKSLPGAPQRSTTAAPAWLLAGMSLITIFIALSLRDMPWWM